LSFVPFKTKKKNPHQGTAEHKGEFLSVHFVRSAPGPISSLECHGGVRSNWLQRVKHSWREQRRGRKLPNTTGTSHRWTLASPPFKPGFPFKKSVNEMKKQCLPESVAVAISPGPQDLSAQILGCQNKKQPLEGRAEKAYV